MEFCLICAVASAAKVVGTYTTVVIIPAVATGIGGQFVHQLIGG